MRPSSLAISLGEYSALAAAAASAQRYRARCCVPAFLRCKKRCPVGAGAMAALLGLDYEAAMAVPAKPRRGRFQAANDNAADRWSCPATRPPSSGARSKRQAKGAKRAIAAAGVRAVPLQADAARGRCDGAGAGRCDDQGARRRWCRNVLAAPITDPENSAALIEQVTGTVRWRESVAYMAAHGVTRFLRNRRRQGAERAGQAHRRRRGRVSIGGPNDIAAAKDALAASA